MPVDLNVNLMSIMPELLVTGLALLVLVLDFFIPRQSKAALGWVSIAGLLCILPVAAYVADPKPIFAGSVLADTFSAYFNVIFIIASIFTILLSMEYLRKVNIQRGEYYHIILFATVGMMVMGLANDLINVYVGLELMALSSYILVAYRVKSSRSVEGALKYFILGALSSGVLLYGMSFVYGAAGSTNLMDIAMTLGKGENTFLTLGLILLAVGFGFKIAAVPFHLWTPDVYEGAPTPVTAFLSVGSKGAAFAAFLRVFITAFPAFQPEWSSFLWMVSAATMIFGSVVAISQKNIVRMLAYSSIAHAGIIMIGLLVFNSIGIAGIVFYLLVYAFMNMGAFALVAHFRFNGRYEDICDYRGLASSRPLLAFLMALFLLSLAGIPPTGGFAAKFFVLSAAIDEKFYWLASIGVVSTAISLFFYAKVIFYMYMKEPAPGFETAPSSGLTYNIVLFITAVGTVFLGIYPTPFIDMAIKAVRPLLM
ncbi:MAG: NADH-quinone oxidoreductase subunit N [Deltaproteobacteria bacterium]|nr:NADH-quinone oxidoreductase subunit N [Deltaproteobacteria bacterium]